MRVEIKPMPMGYRKIPARLRPMPPPIFDGSPSPADVQLARELFRELDRESQIWYRRGHAQLFEGL